MQPEIKCWESGITCSKGLQDHEMIGNEKQNIKGKIFLQTLFVLVNNINNDSFFFISQKGRLRPTSGTDCADIGFHC